MSTTAREFGDGVLARGAAAVHRTLVIEVLLLVTAAPGLLLLVSLAPDGSNAPLAALALVPVGPALAAALYAWRACLGEVGLEPARHFWRGYRANLGDVLRWWVPALAVLTVLVVNLTHLDVAVGPATAAVLRPLLVAVLAVGVLWAEHVLVLTSLFAISTGDAVRLGLHHLTRRPLVTLGFASLTVLAAAVVALTSDWVLAALGSLFALLLLHNARAVVAGVDVLVVGEDPS